MPPIEPPDPNAQQVLRILVDAVDSGGVHEGEPQTFLTYAEVLQQLGRPSPWYYPGSRLQRLGLRALNEWTIRHSELPKVTALIVNKATRMPGRGFAESHGHAGDAATWREWWLREADRAIRFDWRPFLAAACRAEGAAVVPSSEWKWREDEDEHGLGEVIVADPPPARVGSSGVTVAEILQWLAAGESEGEILRQHPGLKTTDIRASLAFAADREIQRTKPKSFTAKWTGRFSMPATNPNDPRLAYLIKRYERNAK